MLRKREYANKELRMSKNMFWGVIYFQTKIK